MRLRRSSVIAARLLPIAAGAATRAGAAPYRDYRPVRLHHRPGGAISRAAGVSIAAAYDLTLSGNWAVIPFVSVSASFRMCAWTSS